MKSQCSQNLSFSISGFFPNYFQVNSQLIHKDEIWRMTYNPKHVLILLPISWFHGGLNKHHMWRSVFLCINDPGNLWHYPALPHCQQLNNGNTKVWWNGFFHVYVLKAGKDSQAPHSVTVLTSVGFGLFASGWCLSSGDAQGKCHFPPTLVITVLTLFNSDTTNQGCKSNKIPWTVLKCFTLEGQSWGYFGGKSSLWLEGGIVNSTNEVVSIKYIKPKGSTHLAS